MFFHIIIKTNCRILRHSWLKIFSKIYKSFLSFCHFDCKNTNTISRKWLTGHMTKILQYLRNKLHLWFSTLVLLPLLLFLDTFLCGTHTFLWTGISKWCIGRYWYISDDGCNYSSVLGWFACYCFWDHTETSAQNTKSHMEMYPNSYNDTMTGETVSCGSEKTDSYSNDGSTHHPDFIVSYLLF